MLRAYVHILPNGDIIRVHRKKFNRLCVVIRTRRGADFVRLFGKTVDIGTLVYVQRYGPVLNQGDKIIYLNGNLKDATLSNLKRWSIESKEIVLDKPFPTKEEVQRRQVQRESVRNEKSVRSAWAINSFQLS